MAWEKLLDRWLKCVFGCPVSEVFWRSRRKMPSIRKILQYEQCRVRVAQCSQSINFQCLDDCKPRNAPKYFIFPNWSLQRLKPRPCGYWCICGAPKPLETAQGCFSSRKPLDLHRFTDCTRFNRFQGPPFPSSQDMHVHLAVLEPSWAQTAQVDGTTETGKGSTGCEGSKVTTLGHWYGPFPTTPKTTNHRDFLVWKRYSQFSYWHCRLVKYAVFHYPRYIGHDLSWKIVRSCRSINDRNGPYLPSI